MIAFIRAAAGGARVIGHVPAAALELNGWRGYQLFDSPSAAWAFLQMRTLHSFDLLEVLAAFLALVLV